MLKLNNKMSNLGHVIKRLIAKKLAIMATELMVGTIVETTAVLINDTSKKTSKVDNLSWIVIVYDKEESKE